MQYRMPKTILQNIYNSTILTKHQTTHLQRSTITCTYIRTYTCTFSTSTISSQSQSQPSQPQSKPKKKLPLPPRPTLPENDLKHVYLKGSGPGGQKINKTSSAVQLTHLPTGLVVKSQATRSRSQNHNIARRILAEKIELIEKGDESRVAKKIERARSKKASSSKKKRRKYRKLGEAREAEDVEDNDDEVDIGEGLESLHDVEVVKEHGLSSGSGTR